ncbi:MFS transporter [Pectinatus brassicae]|uniref:GPH family glycoside/pentoside/hexuronide:cation symporter n=1 Tax=Pectinatus brassicae TaxID=862415 RepID=A0A840UJR5_9FIRM|nr:glycoside-pentoside-hexuronide (GPH):cation symporter [Pectinatus brassicae]MBB5337386.1 GPH family glycoside/pentoside/hexuronide:cation symporter [Pectinatus brassicae]
MAAGEKISIREKICYGLGDSSANIFFGMTMMFLPYFYTDVVGISASAMGFLFLVARFFDAFSDPIIGHLADNTNTKYGHYRPFLLYMAIPYGLSCFLVFLAPEFSPTGKLVYAYITYLFLIAMYASTVVPYVGLLTVITGNPAERLSINSVRFPLAKTAFLLCSVVVPIFVASYDKAHEAEGYRTAMIIIAIIAAVCTLTCFFGTKERVQMTVPNSNEKKTSLLSEVKLIFKTKTLRSFYIFFALTQMAFTFKGSAAIYYAKYYLQQNDAFLTGVLSAFSIAGIVAPIVAMFLINRGVFKKLRMLEIATIGAGIMAIPIMLIPPEHYMISVAFLVLTTFFGELGIIVYWALPCDCAELCEARYNKKMIGVLGALALFSQKFAMGIVGLLIGGILSYVGYVAGGAVNGKISMGILSIVAGLPAICHFVSYYYLRQYDLNEEKMAEIHEEVIELNTAKI